MLATPQPKTGLQYKSKQITFNILLRSMHTYFYTGEIETSYSSEWMRNEEKHVCRWEQVTNSCFWTVTNLHYTTKVKCSSANQIILSRTKSEVVKLYFFCPEQCYKQAIYHIWERNVCTLVGWCNAVTKRPFLTTLILTQNPTFYIIGRDYHKPTWILNWQTSRNLR